MINKIFLSLLVLLFQVSLFAASSDDLLKPDDAFKASITSDSPDKIQVSWDIADGYYMYRKRYSFKSDTQGITLGEPVFPKGKIKEDPGFGTVEVYRHKMLAEIPIIRSNSSASILSLKTSSQGCADIGVCYPPQKKTLSIKLAAATTPEPDAAISKSPIATKKSFSLADVLGITGINNANAPLPPDQAFAYDVSATDKQNLNARWNITEGHYLYQHKLAFSLVDPAEGVSLGQAVLPKGKEEHDQYFGDIIIYNKDFDVQIPVIGKADSITLRTSYQGCSKLTGICYPPQTKTQIINLATAQDAMTTTSPTTSAATAVEKTIAVTPNTTGSIKTDSTSNVAAIKQSEEITFDNPKEAFSTGNEWLDDALNSNNIWLIFFAALGAGLLLAFTACMYPMIPILTSIIVGQGEEVSAVKGFSLASIYVLSLAVTFGIVGALTASFASGVGIQAYFQNPWVLSIFALLFVVLAFSMFGFYDIQVPAALQNKLSELSNKQKGGTFIGVAIMGSLSALIIGPCGGPALAAMLAYAAASSSLFNGFIALFALGLGMGLPLLVVGAGGGKVLPKAGNWMSVVKAVAGVILLAVALVILERMPNIFSPVLTMSLWALLLIVGGIYLGAFSSLKTGVSGWFKLWKGLGLAAVIYGAIVMFGGQIGGQSVTDPLYGINLSPAASSNNESNSSNVSSHVSFKRIKNIEDLKREISTAKQQNKAVMLDFYADWCTYCIKYERYVFPKAKVRKHLDKMVLLQADVTAMDKMDTELMKALGISLPPAILFFNKNGKEIPSSRIVGDMNADEFSSHLKKHLK